MFKVWDLMGCPYETKKGEVVMQLWQQQKAGNEESYARIFVDAKKFSEPCHFRSAVHTVLETHRLIFVRSEFMCIESASLVQRLCVG